MKTMLRSQAVRLAWIALALVALAVLMPAGARAGEVVVDNGRYRYNETFRWEGNHAATVNGGQGTTTWWAENDWDTGGDSAFISVEPNSDDGVDFTNRFHIDIHKAESADPRSGVLDNTDNAIGGDGTPGIGIMHLDYQDIVAARLRNPLLISAQQPGEVTFYAPVFNTTGHWWEVVLTPTDELASAVHSSVPTVDDGLPFPGGGAQPGPGHDSPTPSLNVVAIGSADYPCQPGNDWRVRFGVSKTVNGVRTHYVTPQGAGGFLPTDPAQLNTLVHWRIRFYPDHVELAADMDEDGQFTSLESWPYSVPWSEVHLHLLAAAYQSTHHPDDECNQGHIREMQWRNVSVYPVKYARTGVFPKNAGTQHVPEQLGFRAYDTRDIQRFGSVAGVPQPNPGPFSSQHPGRYCADPIFPCFGSTTVAPALAFTLTQAQLDGLRSAQLVADLKDSATPSVHASVTATLNGQALGRFPEHDAVLPDATNYPEWVRRALPVPTGAVNAGANSLQLALEPGAYIDRIELELLYGAPVEAALFADGFESPPAVAKAAAWRNPALGDLRVAQPWFPTNAAHHCTE